MIFYCGQCKKLVERFYMSNYDYKIREKGKWVYFCDSKCMSAYFQKKKDGEKK